MAQASEKHKPSGVELVAPGMSFLSEHPVYTVAAAPHLGVHVLMEDVCDNTIKDGMPC